jgi:hypothetical protein
MYARSHPEKFPSRAVAPAGRTFTIKKGVVSLKGKTNDWNPQTGMIGSFSFEQAIPGPSPATSNQVKLAWSCPEDQHSETFSFAPAFKKPVPTEVKLQSYLVFDEGTEVAFKEMTFPVDVDDINTLVEYYVNPKSFQMAIGETKTFSFVIKPIVPGPAKFTGKSEFDLQNENYHYRISLDSVEWHYEFASSSSPIETILEYIFNPPDVGLYKISATAKFWIVEFPFSANQIRWPWAPNSSSPVKVTELYVQLFGNDAPLEIGEYYLGQNVKLTFKAFDPSNPSESILIEKQRWIISPPTPKAFSISDDKKKGEVVPVPEKDFESPSISFCLYDFFLSEEEDVDFGRKTGTLLLTIKGKEYPYPFWISYKKPYLKKVEILPPQQRIAVKIDPEDGKWKIGFPNKKLLGIHARSAIFNPTNANYLITSTSFVRLDNEREFTSSPGGDRSQFRKTIPENAHWSFPGEFWLDTWYPGNDPPPISQTLEPHGHIPEAYLADDIPWFLLDLDEPGTPKSFDARASFIVIFWVKPEPMSTTIWCPIRRMVWSWSGKTVYDPEKSEWGDDPNNYSVNGLSNTTVEFPKWPGWAHPTLTPEQGPEIPEYPPWLEKRK